MKTINKFLQTVASQKRTQQLIISAFIDKIWGKHKSILYLLVYFSIKIGNVGQLNKDNMKALHKVVQEQKDFNQSRENLFNTKWPENKIWLTTQYISCL